MHHTLHLVRRHAALLYLVAAVPVLLLVLSDGFPQPALLSTWAIAQGAGIVWIGSETWEGRERWAVRLQVTFVAGAIACLVASQQDANVSGIALVLFLVAVVLLHFAHILRQALGTIQSQLVTVRGFARTEAWRQALLVATFTGPALLAFAPNVIGLAFFIGSVVFTYATVASRAKRRLTTGLLRDAAGD